VHTIEEGDRSPFDDCSGETKMRLGGCERAWVFSLGFVILAALCIPLGYFNLDDNIAVQSIAMLLTILVFMEWWGFFSLKISKNAI